MSFRLRLIIISAVAVAIAIALGSIVSYLFVRNQLVQQLDQSLKDRASQAIRVASPPAGVLTANCPNTKKLGDSLGGARYYRLISNMDLHLAGSLPLTPQARVIANSADPLRVSFTQMRVEGQEMRVYTRFAQPKCALEVATAYGRVDRTLTRLAAVLSVLSLGGIVIAAVLGWLVAGTALRPVRHLTEASEEVARTRDLSRRINARGRDELARLASSFNTMLQALEGSLRAQRQLVADASHELRTPLTTVKTNVEILRRTELSKPERDAILLEVNEQIEELTFLVSDIVELARGVEPSAELEEVRLDLLAAQAVERARRHKPQGEFVLSLEPCVVLGTPSRLDRAISNLLDNACKWSKPDGRIEVTVKDGELSVRDYGPGIDEDDIPFVFDRFYRSTAARSLPGSGLGLAIVRQVAESHGGQVVAERPQEGGGALMRFTLPYLGDV